MKFVFKSVLLSAALAVTAVQAQTTTSLDQLLEQVKKNRVSEARINSQREAEFQSAQADKQALLRKAQAELKAEQQRGDRLAAQYAQNEQTLADKSQELKDATGTLGEMFGVVRSAAGDAYGRIATSVVSAQYPGRTDVVEKMSNESKGLPNLSELEELWFALQTEMTESGKVTKFDADVVNLEGGVSRKSVVRVGTFNLVADNGYLTYNKDTKQIEPLGRQPSDFQAASAMDLNSANAGEVVAFFADPSQGQILNLFKQKATMMERYEAGGYVGYVITVILALGLLIFVVKVITLLGLKGKIAAQKKNTANPSSNNPLGRILTVYQENKNADVENLELKLDEAILKELPSIESGINLIKIFAAIAPLLGLLGTVIGMILTFQQITLFGTGDPKLMAGSISMALVTTAQGIIAALPLILAHAIVAGIAKSVVHILDEQTAGIIAAHAEAEKA
jgi:biopolymer transport protein ExbB